jgi:hypothetical protein
MLLNCLDYSMHVFIGYRGRLITLHHIVSIEHDKYAGGTRQTTA